MFKKIQPICLACKAYVLSVTLLFLMAAFSTALAQNRVSGQVTDNNNEGLPGVNVLVQALR